MEAVDIRLLVLLAVGFAVAAVGVLYRRFRARRLPDIPDGLFLERFRHHHTGSRDHVLAERQRVASNLGVPPQKLSPEQKLEELSDRFGFLADFSVGANDLYDEAAEMRRLAGMAPRQAPPGTVGEVIEDLVLGRKAIAERELAPTRH